MVSAISLCLLALGLTAASSQLESESADGPISERRTFKHGKPVKLLSFGKKHKKFAAFVPHAFGRGPYASVHEVPIIHEVSRPIYKVHRYHHGIEVKPAHGVSFSTPEPFVETHSIEPPSGDFGPSFTSDHSFPSSSFSGHSFPSSSFSGNSFSSSSSFSDHSFSSPSFSDHSFPSSSFSSHSSFSDHSSPSFSDHISYDKPSFPAAPIFAPLPPSPPKQIFSFIPAPAPQPVFQSIPIAPPALPIAHSAPIQPLPPSQPVFSVIPIKIQAPVLPAPSPAPIFHSVPIKIHHPAPALPALPAPTPTPAFSPSPAPVIVKIPSPVLPALPAPSPAPILHSFPIVSATPAPAFPSIPVSLPEPQFSIPAPAPSLPTFSAFPSLPVSAAPEPEFPYPPSGHPIPSYIKDISLGDIDIKGSALPTIEPPKFEDVTPVIDDGTKNFDHGLGDIKHDPGFFQKIKGWKADKANAAFNHLTQFMQRPVIQPVVHHNKIPANPIQFPGSVSQLPLGPPSIFPIFPPAPFHSPAKYENFPPNNIESPPLLNSYGVPIPHDSYAPPHISHERLSSAASEEEPAVVPAPENKEQQNLQRPQHQEFQPQKFQPQAIPHDHPVYIADENKTVNDDNKTIDDVQQETNEYNTPKEPNTDDATSAVHNYPNHKE